MDEEVPRLLERRPGLTVFPIIASPCLWDEDECLKDLEVRPKDREAAFERPDTKRVVLELAREVVGIVKSKSEVAATVKRRDLSRGDEISSRKRHLWSSATLQLKLLVLAVMALVLWMITVGFTTWHIGPTLKFSSSSVKVGSPMFLSPNEPEDLRFYVTNDEKPFFNYQGEKEPLHVKLSLVYEGEGTVPFTGGGEIFSNQKQPYPPPDGIARNVRGTWSMMNGINYLGELARLSLKEEVENQSSKTEDLKLPVAPIPWIKKFKGYMNVLMCIFWSLVFIVWLLKAFPYKRLAV